MLIPVILLWAYIKDHTRRLRDDQCGYTTEAVLATALLTALALAAAAILIPKVIGWANGIHM